MKNIILPKTGEDGKCYLSYSQKSKWKRSIKEYIKSYFFKEPFNGNSYTELGSLVGESLENNNFSEFSKKEIKTLKKVTRLDEFEREIKLDFGDFYVTGYIDTNDKGLTTLIDYKTGALNKVSEYEDDKYDQLQLYAAAIEQETGKLPEKAFVELIERNGNPFKGEKLTIGENVVSIPQDISKEKIEEVKKDTLKVAEEISEYYRVFNLINNIKV